MGAILRYLSHPQVRIDPAVPVPEWGLSDLGRARMEAVSAAPVWARTSRIVSSAETKAREAADIFAAALGVAVEIRPASHENDRSATGFLPPAEFEAVADAFFAEPDKSIRGWETAADAQARIVGEIEAVLAGHEGGDIVVVGHGAVGTLLMCHHAGLVIDRRHDQPAGGGNVFSLRIEDRAMLHGWQPVEALAGGDMVTIGENVTI